MPVVTELIKAGTGSPEEADQSDYLYVQVLASTERPSLNKMVEIDRERLPTHGPLHTCIQTQASVSYMLTHAMQTHPYTFNTHTHLPHTQEKDTCVFPSI